MKIAKKTKTERGVRFDFEDDTSVEVCVDDLGAVICHDLVIHGLSQKLGDSYASAMSVREAKEKFNATLDNLKAGQFNAKAKSAGGNLIDAMVRATGKAVEDVQNLIDQMDDKQKTDLKKHPQVKAALAAIAAERAAAKANAVDGDAGSDLGALF